MTHFVHVVGCLRDSRDREARYESSLDVSALHLHTGASAKRALCSGRRAASHESFHRFRALAYRG